MWSWLKRWLPRSVRSRRDLHVVMYTRQGCHLCETAWAQLLAWQSIYQFVLRAEDVDTNSDWAVKYGQCVPVVEINGKVRFRGHVNDVLLRRLLDAKAETV